MSVLGGDRVDLSANLEREKRYRPDELSFAWTSGRVDIQQATTQNPYFIAPNATTVVDIELRVGVNGRSDIADAVTSVSVQVEARDCLPESDAELCNRLGNNCGALSATDNCGEFRSVTSCGTCALPQICGGGGEPNVCGCSESDADLCVRIGKNCGAVNAMDLCGVERTVASCGTCSRPEVCGGTGEANVCGCPETDAEFCARLGKNCGEVSDLDVCGTSRVTSCGSCATPTTCGGGDGVANVCGGVIQIAAGGRHTCALLSTGQVKCWGSGLTGQLGYNDTANVGDQPTRTPDRVGVVDLGAPATQIATGFFQTCALLTTGDVTCWGAGSFGRLGYGNTDNVGDSPARAVRDAGPVALGGGSSRLAVGNAHACAIRGNDLLCWGFGDDGALGHADPQNPRIGDDETPVSQDPVSLGNQAIRLVSAGVNHTCALRNDDQLYCWGDGREGRLGYGNETSVGFNTTPIQAGAVDVGGTVVQLAAGGRHTCVLYDDQRIRCWGDNMYGQLGYGNTDDVGDNELPANMPFVNVGAPVAQVATGDDFTCVVLTDGRVKCWGRNQAGQLGYGDAQTRGDNPNEVPVQLPAVEVGAQVTQIATGDAHTCALTTVGTVRCWGNGNDGRLGYGAIDSVGITDVPNDVGEVPLF